MNKKIVMKSFRLALHFNLSLAWLFIAVGMTTSLFLSCNDDSEPESTVFNVKSYIDSTEQQRTIESIIGISKIDDSNIKLKDKNVLEKDKSVLAISTKSDGLHYIIPQHVGYCQILVNANGKEYTIVYIVSAEGCEVWQINDVNSYIICSKDVKDSIINDLEKRNIFSHMSNGDELFFYTDPRRVEISYNNYFAATNKDNSKALIFSYEKDSPHYLFRDEKNAEIEQRMSFTLTSKTKTSRGFFNKEGIFSYDPTLIYQSLYGKDRVKKVVIDYEVKNELFY